MLANITWNWRHSILLFLPFLQILSSQTTAPHTLRRPGCASWPSKRRENTTAWKNTHTRTHTRKASKGQQKKHHIKREGAAYQASSKPVNQKYQSCPPSRHGSSFLFFPLLLQSPSSAVQTRAQARPLEPQRPYFGLHTRGSQLALPPCCHARPPGQVVTFGWSSQLFSYKEQRKERAMREDSGS